MLILFIIYFLKYALLNQINLFFFIIYFIFLRIFLGNFIISNFL